LNAARLFLAALAETEQPAHAVRLIGNVETAFESVERLLGALLDISKLDAGVVTPVIADVPLGPCLQRLAAEFAPVAARKGLTLRLVPTAAVVRTDGDMLVRALMNLVSNAIRYTRRGGVLIGVRRQGDRRLRVEVWDSGIGIPPDRQDEIFEEFRRLNTDADQHDRGFGLGLAIVERIARILNHPLSVRSEPARGSCFGLSLPLGSQPSAAPATVGEPEPEPAAKGALLVVIENETTIREGMRVLLQGWGYRVVTAASGELALDQLRRGRGRPAALLADYHLDGSTGPEAIGLVRAGLGGAVPAAIITADRTPEVCREAAALELPLLNKPVRPAQLRALLLHLLELPA
jgi:CheY-like chemotaxis protein